MGGKELHFQKGLSKLSLEPLSDADFEPKKKKATHAGTRTPNPQIRSLVRCPLRHAGNSPISLV